MTTPKIPRPLRVLVTGGAGFIGTHLTRRLLREGCEVTLLDNFHEQVHASKTLPEDIASHVALVVGDVTDKDAVAATLRGQDVVVHLAAETGTGQSMYAVRRYEQVNGLGMATLLDVLVNDPARTITKIVVASSRAVYGEGKYVCDAHGPVYPEVRTVAAMSRGQFEPECPKCALPCRMLPTDEDSPAAPLSFYGLTKYMQERATLMMARAVGISGLALRYQNVYGPGQSLSNPYTGILAIFSNLARQAREINVFEDGLESRDFVFVEDVVDATWRCIHPSCEGVDVFNVGSGRPTTVLEVARSIVEYFRSSSRVSVSGAFRSGDIRHNVANIDKARSKLGFEPRWEFSEGLRAFLDWARTQAVAESGYAKSIAELRAKGLYHE